MSEDRFQGGKEKGRPGTVGGQTAREDISGERGPFELDEDRVLEAFPAPFEDQDDPFPDFPIRPLTEKAHSQRPVTETPLEIDLRLKDKARPWPPAFPQEQAEVPAVAKPKPIDWSAAKTQDGMRRLAEEADALPDLTWPPQKEQRPAACAPSEPQDAAAVSELELPAWTTAAPPKANAGLVPSAWAAEPSALRRAETALPEQIPPFTPQEEFSIPAWAPAPREDKAEETGLSASEAYGDSLPEQAAFEPQEEFNIPAWTPAPQQAQTEIFLQTPEEPWPEEEGLELPDWDALEDEEPDAAPDGQEQEEQTLFFPYGEERESLGGMGGPSEESLLEELRVQQQQEDILQELRGDAEEPDDAAQAPQLSARTLEDEFFDMPQPEKAGWRRKLKHRPRQGTGVRRIKRAGREERRGKTPLYRRILRGVFTAIASLAVLVLVLSPFVGVAVVDGGSMKPALSEKDLVFYLRRPGEIERGDILLFTSPGYGGELLAKRVVGLPGDILEIDGEGYVTLNGAALAEDSAIYGEANMAGDVQFPTRVQDGSYFVLGDNRPVSLDSRTSMVGQVAQENISGEIICWVHLE